jgi:hypothetical protein
VRASYYAMLERRGKEQNDLRRKADIVAGLAKGVL